VATVELSELTKVFRDGTEAVKDVSLGVRNGEFMVLVGPSGSGKSTVLRMIAGLEDPTSGEIRIGGEVVNQHLPRERDLAMVFQNYALYPHMNVYDNLAFALRQQDVSRAEIKRRVLEAAQILGISDLLKRKPRQLSGGQRQRVAMGRALVRQPKAFLMDEPLSNLDAKLRVQMRAEVARVARLPRDGAATGTTTIYVTHDQVEAMTLGDRIAVMRQGRLEQVGEPRALYERPDNLFVAGFIGSPAMNVFSSRVVEEDGVCYAELGSQRLRLVDDLLADRPGLKRYLGREVVLGIRPEHIEDADLVPEKARGTTFVAEAVVVEPTGAEALCHFEIDAERPQSRDVLDLAADVEGTVDRAFLARMAARGRNLFVARLNPETRAVQGEKVSLTPDPSKLFFFDPETESAIR
jgi:multiple sugar transport system ATP-binding protein